MSRQRRWKQSSNAPDAEVECRRFRVTHPFHPLLGCEFELVDHGKGWGSDWVFYVDADTGLVQHLPANWTTVVAEDPFVAVSAGRSHFRITDLLELVKIVRDAS